MLFSALPKIPPKPGLCCLIAPAALYSRVSRAVGCCSCLRWALCASLVVGV
jgi:hypothetical protein